MGSIDVGRVGIWTGLLDQVPSSQAAEYAAELEELGYGAIWYPEVFGRDPFVAGALLLAGTSSIKVATGIANIYARDPMTMANAQRSVDEAFPGRFLLGLGVSHQSWCRTSAATSTTAPTATCATTWPACGRRRSWPTAPRSSRDRAGRARPKMLALSADAAAGAHPYFVPPEHTAVARDVMGPDAALYPEQMVILETDPAAARALARKNMALYLGLPNYTNNLRRLGFEQSDIDGGPGGGPSDRLVDAIVAWGTPEQVAARIAEHFDAGADHVCVQVLADSLDATADGWRTLASHLLD